MQKRYYQYRQQGQSMVEFMIVVPVLLLLIFGALQFAFIYQAKITLNHAAFVAAREGAVNNAHRGIMEYALAQGLAPLYTHCDSMKEVHRARDKVQAEIRSGFGRVEIINPTPAAFSDFGIVKNNERYLPNDNLMYRDKVIGPSSGVNIQDANLLKIRASYCYPLYVPYVNKLLVKIMTEPASADCPECTNAFPSTTTSFEQGCLINNRFPINAQAIIRMHSNAIESHTENALYPGPAPENTNIASINTTCS